MKCVSSTAISIFALLYRFPFFLGFLQTIVEFKLFIEATSRGKCHLGNALPKGGLNFWVVPYFKPIYETVYLALESFGTA